VGLAINNIEREGKHVTEVRYYILSKYTSGARFAEAVREHWSIENRLHWQLDVSYGEDDSRLWRDHAPVNFSLLRRTSLSLLKNESQKKLGIKNKRLQPLSTPTTSNKSYWASKLACDSPALMTKNGTPSPMSAATGTMRPWIGQPTP